MERFMAGEAEAFDALFARHSRPLRAYFVQATRSRAAADDLLQVTFLHLVKARSRFARGERFAPWLYTIARNATRDWMRLAQHRETDDGPLAELTAEAPPEMADPAEVKAVHEALRELPESQREAVVLHHLEGLPFDEVARVLGTTKGAVKVRAHRGYLKLREKLAALRGSAK